MRIVRKWETRTFDHEKRRIKRDRDFRSSRTRRPFAADLSRDDRRAISIVTGSAHASRSYYIISCPRRTTYRPHCCSTLHTRIWSHTLTMRSIVHFLLLADVSRLTRDFPHVQTAGPSSTSLPLLCPQRGFLTYRRSVWRLSRSTSSWFNENSRLCGGNVY